MRRIVVIIEHTYKNLISSKGIWFNMLLPFIVIAIITIVAKLGVSEPSYISPTGNASYSAEQQPNTQAQAVSNMETQTVNNKDVQKENEENNSQVAYEDDSFEIATKVALSSFLSIVFYMICITYTSILATEIAKEKGSKLLEFIFSSIDATHFFLGKMLGVFLVVITNLVLWAVGGFLALTIISRDLARLIPYIKIPPIDLVLILITWFLGICVYLSIAGMLGAMVHKVEDASKAASPVIFTGVIFYILSFMNLSENVTRILSFIPFSAPFIIPKLILKGEADYILVSIAIIILILATLTVVTIAIKNYKKLALNYNESEIFKKITQIFGRGKRVR